MNIEDTGIARVLDAAQTLCIHQGNATADEVVTATGFDSGTVRAALVQLVKRGSLIARPGGIYARALVRELRRPGESYVTDIPRASIAALMGAR